MNNLKLYNYGIIYLNQDADSEEEKARQPMPESELVQMPILVPETIRYACSNKNCDHKTIDDVMLAYHINLLHPGKTEIISVHFNLSLH